MFDSVTPGEIVRLSTLIREYAARGQIGGEVIRDEWVDVGTVERLEALNKPLARK
jgi:MurNAc alpha-1-phosphate uridylyltransferase